MAGVAARWLIVDPKSLQAQRAAARAALALDKVDEAAAHYRVVLLNSPAGVDAEFADVETDLGSDENVFGAHQLADRLASYFPTSPSALRIQGIAAMRADDPAAAVHSLSGALAIEASEQQRRQTDGAQRTGADAAARADHGGRCRGAAARRAGAARGGCLADQSLQLCGAADDGAAIAGSHRAVGNSIAQSGVDRRGLAPVGVAGISAGALRSGVGQIQAAFEHRQVSPTMPFIIWR